MSSAETESCWSTPKKTFKMNESNFVALTPQDVTINTVLLNGTDNADIQSLATPFVNKKTSQNGIFHSCPGLSEKVEHIQKETDETVHHMMADKTYCSPYKANRRSLLESSSNQKSMQQRKSYQSNGDKSTHHRTSYEPNGHKMLGIDSYIQKMSPAQASQCQDLFTAKDEIIEQKDIIMQKQKQIIVQLRQTNMELEELLIQKQREVQSRTSHERFSLHLQEYQYQVQQLKQQLTEARTIKQAEIEKLQKKLGEKEYENGKLEITVKEMEINATSDTSKIKKELDVKISELNSEVEKSKKILLDLKSSKQENSKLQSYLEELPTSDEFKSLQSEVKKLRQEKEELTDKKDLIHKRYKDTRTEYHQKENDYKKLHQKNVKLQEDINSLHSTLQKYRSRDKLGPVSLEEHEILKQDIEELKRDKETLKQSSEKRHKKMKALHYEVIHKQKQHDEEKQVQEDIIQALKDDLQIKSVSVTKLTARSQELLGNTLDLQTDLKQYKDVYTDEYEVKMRELFKQISQCAEDVNSFVTLCVSRMKGNDPSLHALLGLRDSPDKNCSFVTFEQLSIDTIKMKNEAINSIRTSIEELRHIISEQYAQEIGDNMCVTQ